MSVNCVLKSSGGVTRAKKAVYPVVANYSRIEKEEFVGMVERNHGVNRAQVLAVLSAVAYRACAMMQEGHSVEIPFLGTLSICAKGKGVVDEQGRAAMTEVRFWKLRLKPCAEVRDTLRATDFRLLCREVLTSKEAEAVPAVEIMQKLSDETGVFTVADFQNAADCSRDLAQRILDDKVAGGMLRVNRKGRMKIYSMVEKTESEPQGGANNGDGVSN